MKPRKKYRPRNVNPASIWVAMQGACLLSADDQKMRTDPVFEAVEKIAKGEAGKAEWNRIFDAFNMMESFARKPKIMRGATDYIQSMQSTILAILDRQKATKSKALYSAELVELREFAKLWSDILSTVTHREYFEAETETAERLRAILRSKTRGVTVVEVMA